MTAAQYPRIAARISSSVASAGACSDRVLDAIDSCLRNGRARDLVQHLFHARARLEMPL